jgi:hypothetical protein
LRDVTVFQAKLALDGLRDLLLSPISLVAALLDLLRGDDRPNDYFYELMHLGRRSDAWIRLFAAGDRVPPPEDSTQAREDLHVDAVFDRLEGRLVKQYERGGATASAKRVVDRALDSVQRRPGKRPHSSGRARPHSAGEDR